MLLVSSVKCMSILKIAKLNVLLYVKYVICYYVSILLLLGRKVLLQSCGVNPVACQCRSCAGYCCFWQNSNLCSCTSCIGYGICGNILALVYCWTDMIIHPTKRSSHHKWLNGSWILLLYVQTSQRFHGPADQNWLLNKRYSPLVLTITQTDDGQLLHLLQSN